MYVKVILRMHVSERISTGKRHWRDSFEIVVTSEIPVTIQNFLEELTISVFRIEEYAEQQPKRWWICTRQYSSWRRKFRYQENTPSSFHVTLFTEYILMSIAQYGRVTTNEKKTALLCFKIAVVSQNWTNLRKSARYQVNIKVRIQYLPHILYKIWQLFGNICREQFWNWS